MTKQQAMLPYAYFRKDIVPSEQAVISIGCQSMQYGTSCFGGIRGFYLDGKPKIFRLKEHFSRLKDAIRIMGMNAQISWEEFHDIIDRLIKANKPDIDFYIRPFVFTEDQGLGPRFDGINFNLAVYMIPISHYFDPAKGLRMMISSWRKISDTGMPTKAKVGGFYVNSALAATDARQKGYDDALMMDEMGNIVEASVTNLFIVSRGEVIMPEAGSAMLEGITRRTAITFLQEEGFNIRAERIDRSMIYTADELILTGTAAQIMYAQSVDGRMLTFGDKPGPICLLLRSKFIDVLQGNHPNSKEWLTEFNY